MISRIAAFLAIACLCVVGRGMAAPSSDDEVKTIARDAFIYAYPMLYNYKTLFEQTQDQFSQAYIGGFYRFRHYSRVYTPADTDIVTPNNDTPYSWAWLDLRREPWVLTVPEIPRNRYNVFQWFDLYTYNFAYVGVRTTGYSAGSYLFAGPNWKGEAPDGISKVFHSESDLIGTLTRTDTNGPIRELQRHYVLQPLSEFAGVRPPAAAPEISWPAWNEKRALSAEFISYLNFLLQFTVPHDSETALLERFATIGIGPGLPFNASRLPRNTLTQIEAGVSEGMKLLQQEASKLTGSSGLFGTREFLKNDYIKRALGTMVGIYGNSMDEAYYHSFQNGGTPLNGKNCYQLRFEKDTMPPVSLFWSITMYNLPDRLLIDNEIDRYSIGDRTEGLVTEEDGSLTIYIQAAAPDGRKKANWLPAPEGEFSLIGRFYGPGPSLLDGTYRMPVPQPVQ